MMLPHFCPANRRAILPTVFILLAVVLRVWVWTKGEHGMDMFAYKDWTWHLVYYPLSQFYSHSLEVYQDHLPGDLWVMWLLGQIVHLVDNRFGFYGDTYEIILKSVWTLFDAGIALLLFLTSRGSIGMEKAYWLAVIAFVHPVLISTGSIWGQSDAVSMLWFLLALYCYLNGRERLAAVTLTICVLTKPQFGIVAIVLALHWIIRQWPRMRAGSCGLPPCRHPVFDGFQVVATALMTLTLICIPFSVSPIPGLTKWTIWERLALSLDRHPFTTLGAFNLWALQIGTAPPPTDDVKVLLGLNAQLIGTLLFALSFIAILGKMIRFRAGCNTDVLANALVLSLFSYFLFSTRMHERYIFPAAVLALLLLIWDHGRQIEVAILGLLASIDIYLSLSWSSNDPSFTLPQLSFLHTDATVKTLSACMLLLFIYMMKRYLQIPRRSAASKVWNEK